MRRISLPSLQVFAVFFVLCFALCSKAAQVGTLSQLSRWRRRLSTSRSQSLKSPLDSLQTSSRTKPTTSHETKKSKAKSAGTTLKEVDANLTAAYKGFKMTAELPKIHGGWRSQVVFEMGRASTFNCSVASQPEEQEPGSKKSECYIDGEYTDRISLHYYLRIEHESSYAVEKPVVASTRGSEPHPVVYDFSKSKDEGRFYILYNCKRKDKHVSNIRLIMKVTKKHSLTIVWRKKCGGGVNKHLMAGVASKQSGNKEVMHYLNRTTSSILFDKSDPIHQSTTINVRLKVPENFLDFKAPRLVSGDSRVGVQLRNTLTPGTLSADVDTSFTILYTCRAKVQGRISLVLDIPPWDSAKLMWIKDCGRHRAPILKVGLKSADDVMKSGALSPSFNVTEKTTLEEAYKKKIHVVEAETDFLDFNLQNEDSASVIHIESVVTTISSPNVVVTFFERPDLSLPTRSYITRAGADIKPRSSKRLGIHLVCTKRGSVVVLVTLLVHGYKATEFGFIKECDAPHVHYHNGFLRTAGSIGLIVGVALLSVCCVLWRFLRNRRQDHAKYARVPTDTTA